jgi:IclR family transcriptional regulator, KDG regulon repressor
MRHSLHYYHHSEIPFLTQLLGTLVKAMEVLDALGEVAPIGVLDLSRHLGMDKSGVSRILTTLKTRGYVHVRENGQYDIGLRLFELGQMLQERMPVRNVLIPHVDAIAQETGETTFALHYTQGQIAYLYDRVSTQDIRLGERAGMRKPPWNHPAGKVILAFRDEEGVLEDLAAARQVSPKGLPKPDDFRCELSKIRKQGYAEHRDAETCLISVPVCNELKQQAMAALMLGGPAFRIPAARVRSLARLLMAHAREVSQALGWTALK